MRTQPSLAASIALTTAGVAIAVPWAAGLVGAAVIAPPDNRVPAVLATSSCSLPAGATMRIAKYFSGPPTKNGDLKCTGAECSLEGWLYLPKDADKTENHKAVVYLHGHDRDRSE